MSPRPKAVAPRIRVRDVRAFVRRAAMRMPFKFGAVTMTDLSVVFVQVRFDLPDGRSVEGVGSSVLSPMWFDKSADRSYEQKQHGLLRSIALASAGYREAEADNGYGLHQLVQPAVRAQCEAALTSSFGVAMIDGALVDGLCRAYGTSLHAGLRDDLFGFGAVPWLPPRPVNRIALRHTVGLTDPLVAADVTTPLSDGLPQTLTEVIREYGVTHFKVKISNDVPANLERLQGIQSVLVDEIGEGYRLVLDGNEQFADMAGFTDLLDGMRGDSELRHLFDRVLWFEQPVEREAALAEAVDPDLAKPIILDESDGTDETVSRALQLGYAGVSAKNCKGVFRTLHSRRVLAEWEAEHGGPAILAAEDLTHPGVHALQQDTAVIAALGIEHAERNGHHYVRGLSFLPEAEQTAALRDFPSLYERTADGLVRLRIDGGYISTQEICERGYGGEPLLDLDALESLDPSCPPC